MRRTNQGIVATLFFLGLVSLVASPALSSTFLAMDMEKLVTDSDNVVQGKVIEVQSFWDAEGRVIMTDAVVAVEETLAGERTERIRVRTFGGEVAGYTVEAVGFPRFEMGDRVVLFVNQRESKDGSIRVTGYQQGHYLVVDRKGVDMAVPTLEHGVTLVPLKGQLAPKPEVLPLETLKREVQQTVQRLQASN